MKRLIKKILEELFEKAGIKGDVNQYSEMATPIVLLVFAGAALFFAFSYWRSYTNWEGEGDAPKVILLSAGFLGLVGLGLAGFGLSYLL